MDHGNTPSQGGAPALQQMLRLACAEQHLVVPIEAVREILEVTRFTVIPQAPEFLRGVMNLRGAVIPVIDMASRFGLGVTTIGRRSAIVVVEVRGDDGQPPLVLGMLVDAVYEVLDVELARIEAVPSLGLVVPPAFVAGMVNVRNTYACLLNLAATLAPEVLTRLIGPRNGATNAA